MKNLTEEYYFSPLDKSGQRLDKYSRPEICNGSYEFIANSTYMRKEKPQNEPVYVFILDCSLASIQNGFLSSAIETIKDSVNNDYFPTPDKTKVTHTSYY